MCITENTHRAEHNLLHYVTARFPQVDPDSLPDGPRRRVKHETGSGSPTFESTALPLNAISWFVLDVRLRNNSSCNRLSKPANPPEAGLLLPSSDGQATQTGAAALTSEAELILPRLCRLEEIRFSPCARESPTGHAAAANVHVLWFRCWFSEGISSEVCSFIVPEKPQPPSVGGIEYCRLTEDYVAEHESVDHRRHKHSNHKEMGSLTASVALFNG